MLSANCSLRHSVYRHSWLDIGQTLDITFRPPRIHCAFPIRFVSFAPVWPALVDWLYCCVVLTVNYVVQDGKSNCEWAICFVNIDTCHWLEIFIGLEGMILMCKYILIQSFQMDSELKFIVTGLYLILGVVFWYYPGSDPSGLLAQCHWSYVLCLSYHFYFNYLFAPCKQGIWHTELWPTF